MDLHWKTDAWSKNTENVTCFFENLMIGCPPSTSKKRRGANSHLSSALNVGTSYSASQKLAISRAKSLQLSKYRDVDQGGFESSVFCMDLEKSDERYLLCGSANGGLSILDLECCSQTPECQIKAIAKIKRSSKHSHQSMIVSCQWYPQDTGMFVTASTDKGLYTELAGNILSVRKNSLRHLCIIPKTLRVWDSNKLRAVDTFRFENPLNHHHWSVVPAGKSSLIAVAAGISNVQIIDIRSGSMMQQLRGHSMNVTCVQWSPRDAHILSSADKDGKIMIWDIRSGKSFLKSLVSKNSATMKTASKVNISSKSYGKKAHGGTVNGLKFSPDGLFLLSFGTEGFLKCWDAVGLKEIVNSNNPTGFHFPANYAPRLLIYYDMAYFGAETVIYIPTDDDIEMVNFSTGKSLGVLRGHYNPVNSCVYRPSYQELYSAGSDKHVLCWVPKMDQNQMFMEEKTMGGRENLDKVLQDNWSDDD